MAQRDRIIVIGGGGEQRSGVGGLIGTLIALGAVAVGGYVLYRNYQTCKWPFDGSISDLVGLNCSVEDGNGTIPPPPVDKANQTFSFKYAQTAQPVSGVSVLYNNETKTTDATGKVTFLNVPIGTQYAYVSKPNWHISNYAAWFEDKMEVVISTPGNWNYIPQEMYYALEPDIGRTSFKINGQLSGPVVALGSSGDEVCGVGACCAHPDVTAEVIVKNRWGEPIEGVMVYLDSYDGLDQMCFSLERPRPWRCNPKVQAYGNTADPTNADGKFNAWLWARSNNNYTFYCRCLLFWTDPFTGELTSVEMPNGPIPVKFQKCTLSYYTCYEGNKDMLGCL